MILLLSLSGCSYGPVKQRVVMDQVVRAGDTYTGYVLIETMTFREPTGFINTFPNGGRPTIFTQHVKVYKVDAQDSSIRMMADLTADHDLWEAFSGHIVGFDDNNVPYLQLRGCKKGGECYGDITNYRYFHLNAEGSPELLSQLPPHKGLPPIRGSRRQGEINYVRFSISRDTLKAKLQENAEYQSIITTGPDGNLIAID
jgi:hypothetical protein